jgi:hypothetical protein
MAHAHSDVSSIARISTISSASASGVMPNICVSASRRISAMKADSMKTSP